jgi:flagellar biogenesis protein FliO
MIPEPSPDFLWLRLLLSLVFVVAIFFPLLYVMKRSLLRRAIR